MSEKSWRAKSQAIREKQALALKAQPTTLRRCLQCDTWMRSTGRDHRVCNVCKGLLGVCYSRGPGSRVRAC